MAWINRKITYRACFVRFVVGIPTVVRYKTIDPRTFRVKFRDKLFMINADYPSYRRKNRVYYMIDIDGDQITTLNNIVLPNPKLSYVLFKNEAFKQMSSLMDSNGLEMKSWIMILLGVGCGIAIGILIGQQMMPTGATP